jgi:uncharacterized protein YndB with AHSA1/START domain
MSRMIRSFVLVVVAVLAVQSAEATPFDVQADAALDLPKSCDAVWRVVGDLAKRPNLKSSTPLAGTWPAEGSRVRAVMDKSGTDMVRTETVVRLVPGKRLLLKIDAPELSTVAWLDHRLSPTAGGCRFEMSVIVAIAVPEGALAPDRAAYADGTSKALLDAVSKYGAAAR